MPINVENTIGAILLSVIFSAVVYGIVVLQTYNYFTKYSSEDRFIIKFVVASTVFLITMHLLMYIHIIYYYAILSFSNLLAVAQATWSMQLIVGFGAIHVVIVQGFFAYRIYVLSHGSLLIPAVVMVISLAQLAFALSWTFMASQHTLILQLLEKTQYIAITALALDIASNTIVTASMIYYLRAGSSDFGSTKKVVDTLITYAIKTCLLITICTITATGLLVAEPLTFTHSPPYQIATYLYANALLSTLNNRDELRARLATQVSGGSIRFGNPASEKASANLASKPSNYCKTHKKGSSSFGCSSTTTVLVQQETWSDAKIYSADLERGP